MFLQRTPLIDAFHARFPGLRVELVTSDRFLDLSKGDADIAIRLGEPSDEALVGRKIADASWAVYAGRTYGTDPSFPWILLKTLLGVVPAKAGTHNHRC